MSTQTNNAQGNQKEDEIHSLLEEYGSSIQESVTYGSSSLYMDFKPGKRVKDLADSEAGLYALGYGIKNAEEQLKEDNSQVLGSISARDVVDRLEGVSRDAEEVVIEGMENSQEIN